MLNANNCKCGHRDTQMSYFGLKYFVPLQKAAQAILSALSLLTLRFKVLGELPGVFCS